MVEWRSAKFYRTWPEFPLILDLESGHPIVYASVGIRARCEAYSKYVYKNGVWSEEALPETFEKRATNLFIRNGVDMPRYVDLKTKRKDKETESYAASLKQAGPTRQVCGD